MILKLISGPTVEPISLLEAKEHLRVNQEFTSDDLYIGDLISDARKYCEAPGQNRVYLTQTWELSFDNFPEMPVKIPRPPLQSVESITYKDKDGNINTWDPANYVVDCDSEPGRISHAYDKTWPAVVLWPLAAVKIRFKAGYTQVENVDRNVRRAMLLLIGHWYECREEISADKRFEAIPFGVSALLGADRVVNF